MEMETLSFSLKFATSVKNHDMGKLTDIMIQTFTKVFLYKV